MSKLASLFAATFLVGFLGSGVVLFTSVWALVFSPSEPWLGTVATIAGVMSWMMLLFAVIDCCRMDTELEKMRRRYEKSSKT
jgi:hypothetical protein